MVVIIIITTKQYHQTMMRFTRFLYCYDEVKINILISLLEKREFKEVIFWAAEIYCSGLEKELWNYIWKIYYDFYALQTTIMAIEKNQILWELSPKFIYILNVLFILFHSKISLDVFILANAPVRKIPVDLSVDLSVVDEVQFSKKLRYSIKTDREKTTTFIKTRYGLNERANHCLFQQLFVAVFFREPTKPPKKKPKKKPKIKISKSQLLYSMGLVNFEKKQLKPYKILKEMRHFQISKYTNGFKLEREKVDLEKIFRMNWEYYANFSPYWNKKFKFHKGKINRKTREMAFKNDNNLDDFYDMYNMEPDEQELETQEKSIKKLVNYKTIDIMLLLPHVKLLSSGNKIDFRKVKY